MTRDLIQWSSDQLILLHTINYARKIKWLKRTRLQKIVFLSQYKFYETNQEGFTYQFFRFNHGPYSTELNEDLDNLERCDIINESNRHGYYVLPYGHQILEKFDYITKRNPNVFKHISKITKNIMLDDFERMLQKVYARRNPANQQLTIEETPHKSYILTREMLHIDNPFDLTEEEAATIELMMDEENIKKINEADKAIREKKYKIWTPL